MASALHAPTASAAIAAPGGLAPTESAISGIPVLSWNRVPGAASYTVQYSVDPNFSSGLTSVSTVNARYVPRQQLAAGTIWWRVQAKSSSGSSDWSTTSFTSSPKAGPALLAPADGDTLNQPADPLLLSWSPVSGAATYTIQIDDDDDNFAVPDLTVNSILTTAYVLQDPNVANVANSYHWRVRAVYDGGVFTDWSDTFDYQIGGLGAPTYVAPFDDPNTPTPETTVDDVVIQWNPVPGAHHYELQVSLADTFNTFVDQQTSVVGTIYSPSVTYINDQYFWRVRAVDAFGNKPPWENSAIWTFERAWPDQPTLQYPINNQVADDPLYFQWSGVTLASKYTVWWKLTSEGGWHGGCATVNTVLVPHDAGCGPTAAGNYEWRVSITDDPRPVPGVQFLDGETFTYAPGTNESASGSVSGMRASITGMASEVPATSCAAALPSRCEDMRQTPVLRWNPVTGATSYKLWISNDAVYTNVVPGYNGLPVRSTMFNPRETLGENQAANGYYWQVTKCVNDVCDPPTQATHVFNKKSNLVELIAPIDNATGPDSITFTWRDWLESNSDPSQSSPQDHVDDTGVNPTLEAKLYRVEVSQQPNFQSILYTATVDQRTHTAWSTFFPDGVLYWRVRVIDGSDRLLSFSNSYAPGLPDVRKFNKTTPPPVLKQLNNGAPVTEALPFEWFPTNYTASYNIEIYKNNDTLGQLSNRVVSLNSKTNAVTLAQPLAPAATPYRWRLQKVDAAGRAGAWSSLEDPVAAFTVAVAAPTQTSPGPGVLLSSTGGYFAWTAVAGAKSYRFERRKTATTTLSESTTTSALAWAPTATYADGGWQWRVVAVNSANADLGASGWRNFTVDGTVPTVTSFQPAAGSTIKRKQALKAIMSEAVTNATVKTVTLKQKGGKKVKGVVKLAKGGTVIKFKAKKRLKPRKKYVLTITTGVTDLSGTPLAKKAKAKFTVQ